MCLRIGELGLTGGPFLGGPNPKPGRLLHHVLACSRSLYSQPQFPLEVRWRWSDKRLGFIFLFSVWARQVLYHGHQPQSFETAKSLRD